MVCGVTQSFYTGALWSVFARAKTLGRRRLRASPDRDDLPHHVELVAVVPKVVLGLDLDVDASGVPLDLEALVPLNPLGDDAPDPREHVGPSRFELVAVEPPNTPPESVLKTPEVYGRRVEAAYKVGPRDLHARARDVRDLAQDVAGASLTRVGWEVRW